MNSKKLLLSVLLILIVLSKEILVFNEEILVLLSSGIFIFLTYNFASGMISLELDSRANKIQEEFNYYRDMQEKTLIHLISYHNKQKLLSEEIKAILLLFGSADSSLIFTKNSYPLNKKRDNMADNAKEFHGTVGPFITLSTVINFRLSAIIVPKVISIITEILLATNVDVSIPK